jgi:phosphoribosylglycinamide formyltransferase-1
VSDTQKGEEAPPVIGVLISGRGTNLAALIEAVESGRLHARIGLVVSSQPGAAGMAVAARAGLDVCELSPHGYGPRAAYDEALVSALTAKGVRLVCLAGFMRLLGTRFCAAFPRAVINIHPSLLPAFPGRDAQRQALEHGVKVSGATVHLVTPELDAGPIVSQRAVPVLDTDTPESLAARILAVEHEIYPDAVQRILWEPWHISGRRVIFGEPHACGKL